MRPIRLRTRLTILIASITVPIFVAVILYLSREAGKLLEHKAVEDLQEISTSLSSSMSRWLRSREVLLIQLTALPDIRSMDANRQRPALQATARADPDLFLVQTTDVKGRNVARNDDAAPKDYHDRRWFRGARAGNPVTIEVLISRTTGDPALNMSRPIRNARGSIIGVASIVNGLDEVATAVQAGRVGTTGFSYVVDESGRVIAHPDLSFSRELHDLSAYPPVALLRAGVRGPVDFTDKQGVSWAASIALLDSGWGIVAQQQKAELLAPLRSFQILSGIFSLAGLLVLLVSAWSVIRRALHPIDDLTEAASAIAGGNIDRLAPVVRADEIGALAGAFNNMTNRMRELIRSLEQRIGELDRAQGEIRTSLLRQSALLDNIPDIAWLKDQEGRFIAVNGPFGKICGVPPADLAGKTDLDIWPRDLAEAYRKDDFEVMRTGQRKQVVERLVDSTGQESWIETIKTPIFDASGVVIGTAGIARDISERKQVEEALRRSEERLNFLLANSPSVIYTSKASGDYGSTFMSDNIVRQLGYEPREFIDDPGFWAEHIHPDDAPRIFAGLPALYEKGVHRHEYRFRHKDGTWRWMHDELKIVRNGNGEPIEIIGAWNDITERKQAEAERERLINELEMRNAELERFTYTVSHDLKSPLITMRGFLGYLEKDAQAGNMERVHADIGRIQDATSKMDRLLRELLELSRIGRVMNPPQEVSFEEIAREAVGLVSGRLQERGVRVDIAGGMPIVSGDRIRLVEVVQNLVDNAAKFMGSQPEPFIEIGVRNDQQHGNPVFFVRDNGIGIEPRYEKKIFGLFDKLDPKSEGTGVGLALVKRIIEVHGGQIWLESEGPEKGSTFCFTLPRTQRR